MKQRHVIIVGGGAAGLVAAITAAREGALVTIIEHKDKLGKKILSTGNGRCNLTNEYMDLECFRGDDVAIVSDVLNQFGYNDTIKFFEELGVILKNRQGYVYPISDQASTILDVLCMEIKHLNITVCLDEHVTDVKKVVDKFHVITSKKTYTSDALILATGGKAAPVLGSDGSGYKLAKTFGHNVSPVVPALIQLKGKGNYFKQISGVRTQAKVSLYINNAFICSDTGELQLTNYGISGIPVFQISRYAAKGLYKKDSVAVELDLIPSMDKEEFDTYMKKRLSSQGFKTAEDFLVGVFHQKLIGLLLKSAHIKPETTMSDVLTESFDRLLFKAKHLQVEIEGTNDFDQAQVCAGGVFTKEVNSKTLESIYTDDLYLTGELLDIDGICGGYNLQWAWSTGYIAGKNAAKG